MSMIMRERKLKNSAQKYPTMAIKKRQQIVIKIGAEQRKVQKNGISKAGFHLALSPTDFEICANLEIHSTMMSSKYPCDIFSDYRSDS